MKLTKKEQLEKVFKKLLTDFSNGKDREYFVGDMINTYVGMLIKEVTIRTNLK